MLKVTKEFISHDLEVHLKSLLSHHANTCDLFDSHHGLVILDGGLNLLVVFTVDASAHRLH